MRSRSRLVWLGLTPEPERELPVAVATLRAHLARRSAANADITQSRDSADPDMGRYPDIADEPDVAPWIKAEMSRIDDVIMHGTQRSWLRYLSEVTALITAARAEPADLPLALHAAETVLDHHRMLIGLPGPAYAQVAADREALIRIVSDLRAAADRR